MTHKNKLRVLLNREVCVKSAGLDASRRTLRYPVFSVVDYLGPIRLSFSAAASLHVTVHVALAAVRVQPQTYK